MGVPTVHFYNNGKLTPNGIFEKDRTVEELNHFIKNNLVSKKSKKNPFPRMDLYKQNLINYTSDETVADGSVIGGSVAGGSVIGGSVAGGWVAGGRVAGGRVAGGRVLLFRSLSSLLSLFSKLRILSLSFLLFLRFISSNNR